MKGPVGIQIGYVEKETVAAVKSLVMAVLECDKSGDTAKVAAFEMLRHSFETKNCSISNVSINMGAKPKVRRRAK